MSRRNTIRNQELSEDVQEEISESVEEKVEETRSFLRDLFSPSRLSSYLVARNLPCVGLLAFFGFW